MWMDNWQERKENNLCMFDLVGRKIQFDSTVKAQIEHCEDGDVQINNNT